MVFILRKSIILAQRICYNAAMAKKKPARVKEQYSYSDRGKVKVSVPLASAVDSRLTKLAKARKVSKAKLAADLLTTAVA